MSSLNIAVLIPQLLESLLYIGELALKVTIRQKSVSSEHTQHDENLKRDAKRKLPLKFL